MPFVHVVYTEDWRRYRRPEDARMALEQMDGFELAGRTVSHSPPFIESYQLHYSSESIPYTRRVWPLQLAALWVYEDQEIKPNPSKTAVSVVLLTF